MTKQQRTNDYQYRMKRQALKDQQLPCHICGMPIDYSLKWPDEMSFSYDHLTPIAAGGHNLGEGKAAHLLCNKKRGAKTLRDTKVTRRSREW